MKIDNKAIIEAYENGESMNSIARAFGTYATTVKRVLEKHGVELRHDERKKGSIWVHDGEKLIEWAKAQGRLVTKSELAAVAGTKRLSPSYFIKYPELGQYIKTEIQTDLQEYYDRLYEWLKENDIPYKPGDRTKLNIVIDALLLGEYSNLILQISERPYTVSKKTHNERMELLFNRAKAQGMTVVFLNKDSFEDLDKIKALLDDLKD